MRWSLGRWPRPLLAVAAAVSVAAGCDQPQHPTAPRDGAAPVAAARAAAPVRVAPDVFDDVTARLLPSFADQARADELRARLTEFSAAYTTGDDAGARLALARAKKLLEKGGAHAANLSALGLALGRAEALTASTATTETAP